MAKLNKIKIKKLINSTENMYTPWTPPPYFYIVLTKYQIRLFETLIIVAGAPDNIGVDTELKCNMKRSSARFALHLVKFDF